jgi:hypothetical protein
MNIDVEIYVSQFKTFFKDNPEEFKGLIGKGNPDEFFNELRIVAENNLENGEDIELTRKQLIGVVLKINKMEPSDEEVVEEKLKVFMDHPMGRIWLN